MNTQSRTERLAWWAVLSMTVLYVAFFAPLSIRKHKALMTHGFDLGNVDQAVWNTLKGRPLRMTNEEGTENRLGTHCDPIIALLAPLYLIHSGPETLLIVQTLALALVAFPVFWLARERLRNSWAGVAFALAYLGSPPVQGANLFEFHALTLGAAFLTWGFYFLHRDRDFLFVLFSVFAVFCKEDVALVVAMLGLYAFLIGRRRRMGALVAALGGVWFFVAVTQIIPRFNDAGQSFQLSRYAHLGNGLAEIVRTILTRPGLVVADIRSHPLKVIYLLKLLFPVGYLSLVAPHVLLLSAPSILINLLSANSEMYALDIFHYSVAVIPFVNLSAVWAIATLAHVTHHWLKVQRGFTVGVLVVYVLVLSSFYHWHVGYSPLGRNFDWFQITEHERLGEQLARSIPSDAIVSAQNHLNPHVSQRETVYVFPRVDDADYILLDVTRSPGLDLSTEEYHFEVQSLIADKRFGVTLGQDGYIVLQRGAASVPLGPEFYSFARTVEVAGMLMAVDFDVIQLRGLRFGSQAGNVLEIHSYWSAGQLYQGNLHMFVCLVDREGTPLPGTVQETIVSRWYPPHQWNTEELVYDRAVLQLPAYEDLSALSVGFFAGPRSAVKDSRMRLPVTLHVAWDRISVREGILAVPYE